MTVRVSDLFTMGDRLQMASLNFRVKRGDVINSNIANAETPGYRAIGYDFEEQLRELAGDSQPLAVKVTHGEHKQHSFANMKGEIVPDVFVRPTESVGHDGNTVDVDKEMSELAHNQILFRTAVETLNKKIGLFKYAIHGGRA